MTEHLTQIEIYEVAADEPVAPSVTSHSVNCAECAAEVTATRRVLDSVQRLGRSVETRPDLDHRLVQRLDALSPPHGSGMALDERNAGHVRTRRRLIGAVVAVACFTAGVASHAAWTSAEGRQALFDELASETPPALAVQQAGTNYVAAIALMVEDSNHLSTDDLNKGREVALAAMSGAAFELRQLRGGDPVADELHEMVELVRYGDAVGVDP